MVWMEANPQSTRVNIGSQQFWPGLHIICNNRYFDNRKAFQISSDVIAFVSKAQSQRNDVIRSVLQTGSNRTN